ncbi:MFS transporter [Streptomyces sp. NPDC002896]|uniref:MFS transporter n=1 Tax=Streptomyces sp. NPDC002896 TaxID=3154438 RepID=UPI003329F2BA
MRTQRLPAEEKMARKAGWASFMGSTIEWYDFYVYGTASALVFGPLFFSQVPDSVGVLLSFATFWIGFLARPLGGIVFGHLGDRLGRKKALVATLLLMGVSTVGIGLLPTYEQVGLAAPLLLTLLRAIQGVALGGEWGGAVLIATEHAKKERGFLFGAFAQQGSPTGRILATLSFLAVGRLSDEALLGWAWRIPFVASAVLVVIGLVIRLSLQESPAVVALRASQQTAKVPVVSLFREHTKLVLLGVAAGFTVFAVVYARDTFALSWATSEVGMDRQGFLTIILIASVVQFFVQPLGALVATRWGVRKAVTLILACQLPTIPVMFGLIGTGNWVLALIGAIVATIPDVMYYAIIAGMFAQAFPAKVRYTGIATTYGLAGVLGGMAPVILQSLLAASGSIVMPIGFVVVLGAVSLLAARAFLTLSARLATQEPADPATVAEASPAVRGATAN